MRELKFLVAALAISIAAGVPTDARADRENRRNAAVRVVEKVSPAVVNIATEQVVERSPFGGGMPRSLSDFFRLRPRREKVSSLGSGVIIDESGVVLTNSHVIQSAASIKVYLLDERVFDATVIGADPASDLAVLKIDSDKPLPHLPMGTSSDLMPGEDVIAIGNPFGLSHTVTRGILSQVNRSFKVGDREFYDFLQTDTAINPGNSGGPLLNIEGGLIGINTAIMANAEGIGYAIPIDRARRIVEDLLEYGKVIQAWLGLVVQELSAELAYSFGVKPGSGVLVAEVIKDSPAEDAGVKRGDLITELNGQRVGNYRAVSARLRSITVGNEATLEVIRDKATESITVKSGKYPESRFGANALQQLGLSVGDTRRGVPGIVITGVRARSWAARVGIRKGDLIRKLGRRDINSSKDFLAELLAQRRNPGIVIVLQRGNVVGYVTYDRGALDASI